MNAWLVAATVVLVALVPLGAVVATGRDTFDRLVAFELAGVLDVTVLLLLAAGFHRSTYADLAVVLSLLSLAGGLAFARFLERWL